ncbi:O-antigen ligase [Isoptericola sp. BMS4]|uniref:O-antigen ligase family protein n=1 Tax=Isoptericola sp. BMS4 TaxID=2527875 RepID=UPI00141FCF9A|nr:O-antigen ligase family protein [Isoptericola sp. BMS4]
MTGAPARALGWALVATVTALALLTTGALLPAAAPLGAAAAVAVLAVGATVYDPVAVPVLAMPALVVVQRVGGGGVDLSVSDLALAAAFGFAALLGPRPLSRPMRTLLWLAVAYQVATLFTVIAHPYVQNTVEWFHAGLSTAGALLVGWAVGRGGHARAGLTLLVLPCLAIAALACVAALRQLAAGSTGAVYLEWPVDMHKNFIGCVLAMAAVVVHARPPWLRWPTRLALPALGLLVAGVAASQARQAMVGLVVGLLVVSLRPDPDRRRSRLVLLAAVPAVYGVWTVVREQLASGDRFNSAHQRLTWYEEALDVWRQDPLFGVGLRWWTAGRTEYTFQPPNAELEVLSSAGIVGLTGFLVLAVGTLVVLWRLDPRFGTLAVAVLLTRFVQGQFDLFWVSVQVSVPFVVAGVCVGAEALAARDDEERAAGVYRPRHALRPHDLVVPRAVPR